MMKSSMLLRANPLAQMLGKSPNNVHHSLGQFYPLISFPIFTGLLLSFRFKLACSLVPKFCQSMVSALHIPGECPYLF